MHAVTRAPRIAGIDGCKAGWFVVTADVSLDNLSWFVAETIRDAVAKLGTRAVVGIDIPIGLPDAGSRQCDILARRRLPSNRKPSVFPAPIRRVLRIRDYRKACDLHESIDGKRMSAQAFNIVRKVDEVDRFVRDEATRGTRLYEVHPELAFAEVNDGMPVRCAKRKAEGFARRFAILAEILGEGTLEAALAAFPRAKVAKDDVLDAFAVLLTARRISDGQGTRIPETPEYDTAGIDMAIWF